MHFTADLRRVMQNLRNPEGLVQWRVCFLGEDIQDMVGNANPLSSVGDFWNTCQSLKGKLEFLFFFLQFPLVLYSLAYQ